MCFHYIDNIYYLFKYIYEKNKLIIIKFLFSLIFVLILLKCVKDKNDRSSESSDISSKPQKPVTQNPDGSEGSDIFSETQNPDGSEGSDISSETQNPDGSEGSHISSETQNPDGSEGSHISSETQNPDGSESSDISSETQNPDGSEGSVTQQDEDENLDIPKVPALESFIIKTLEHKRLYLRAEEYLNDILNKEKEFKLTTSAGDPGLGKTYITELLLKELKKHNKIIKFISAQSVQSSITENYIHPDLDLLIIDDMIFSKNAIWSPKIWNSTISSLQTILLYAKKYKIHVWINSNSSNIEDYIKETHKRMTDYINERKSRNISRLGSIGEMHLYKMLKTLINNKKSDEYKYFELKGSSLRKGLVDKFGNENKKFNTKEFKQILELYKGPNTDFPGGIIFVPYNIEQLLNIKSLKELNISTLLYLMNGKHNKTRLYHAQFGDEELKSEIFGKLVKQCFDENCLLIIKTADLDKKNKINDFFKKRNNDIFIKDFIKPSNSNQELIEIIDKYKNNKQDKAGILFVSEKNYNTIKNNKNIKRDASFYNFSPISLKNDQRNIFEFGYFKLLDDIEDKDSIDTFEDYKNNFFQKKSLLIIKQVPEMSLNEFMEKARDKYKSSESEERSYKVGFIDRFNKAILFRHEV